MDPPRLGAAAGVALFALVVLPYAVVDSASVSVYYAAGPVGPPVFLTFAGVALVALLSGAAGRSDPAVTAGVAVTLSAVAAALAVAWALAAAGVAGGIATAAAFDYHRWALAGAALALAAASAWTARRTL